MSQLKSILPKMDPEHRSGSQHSSREEELARREQRNEGRRSSRKKQGYGRRRAARSEETENEAEGLRPHKKRSSFNRSSLGVFALLGLLLLILIPTALTLHSTSKQLTETKAMQSSLETQREELQTSVNDLKSQLDIVNTDQFIEKYAHEKLGMLRPNEILMEMADGKVKINEEALAKYKAQQAEKKSSAAPASSAEEAQSVEGDASGENYGLTSAPLEQSPAESTGTNDGQ